jgi:hypothetical protein
MTSAPRCLNLAAEYLNAYQASCKALIAERHIDFKCGGDHCTRGLLCLKKRLKIIFKIKAAKFVDHCHKSGPREIVHSVSVLTLEIGDMDFDGIARGRKEISSRGHVTAPHVSKSWCNGSPTN